MGDDVIMTSFNFFSQWTKSKPNECTNFDAVFTTAYCTCSNTIEFGDPRSKVKVTVVENASQNEEKIAKISYVNIS